jgi:hypothetical protein
VRSGATDCSTDFTIHDSLLRESSEFFAAALRAHWRESVEGAIHLPHGTLGTFSIYSSWLYNRKIYTSLSENEFSVEGAYEAELQVDSAALQEELTKLIRCWILGDCLLDTNFKDTVMDALILQRGWIHHNPTVRFTEQNLQ